MDITITQVNTLRADYLYVRQDSDTGEFYVYDGRSVSYLRHYTGTYCQCLIFVGARAVGHEPKFAISLANNAAKRGV